jgi:hypothetical protein
LTNSSRSAFHSSIVKVSAPVKRYEHDGSSPSQTVKRGISFARSL